MKKIRFGITGAGYMGRTHAEAIKRLAEKATLVAIAGGSRAPGLAARYQAECERDARSLIARQDIDAVVITTPQAVHLEEVTMALEAGKHVLIEKPMATTVEDGQRMLDLASRRGRVIAVGYNLRFRTNAPKARELIASGAIGRVAAMHYTLFMDVTMFDKASFGGNKSWFHAPENVGILIDGLCHGIDTMRWVTGAEVTTVGGFCRTSLPGRTNKDTGVGVFEFSNGAIASVIISCAVPGPYPREYSRYSIIGTEGLLDMDVLGDLHISDRTEGWRLVTTQPTVAYADPEMAYSDNRMNAYRDQIHSFIDGIDGKPMRAGSGADGQAGLVACLALIEASQERRLVRLR